MELHVPNYYPRFRCLADKCPHTCCAWWEVPVDEESAEFYQTAPGELGQRLRDALAPDGEGGVCLRLTGGACPLLDERGLCSVQLQWGQARAPAICREHPRFSYDYGPLRELGLCASCPEAARLILEEDFSLSVRQEAEEAPGEEAGALLFPLLPARETAFSLLRARRPLSQRLQALLLFANDLQNALDEGDEAALAPICRLYARRFPLPEPSVLPPRSQCLQKALSCLGELEILCPDWPALLSSASADAVPPEAQGGRCAAYILYRHWLRALNDGDLLTWCELAALAAAVAGALSGAVEGGFPEAFRRFCLEVEHSQPNLDALQERLWHDLSLSELLSLSGW